MFYCDTVYFTADYSFITVKYSDEGKAAFFKAVVVGYCVTKITCAYYDSFMSLVKTQNVSD